MVGGQLATEEDNVEDPCEHAKWYCNCRYSYCGSGATDITRCDWPVDVVDGSQLNVTRPHVDSCVKTVRQ